MTIHNGRSSVDGHTIGHGQPTVQLEQAGHIEVLGGVLDGVEHRPAGAHRGAQRPDLRLGGLTQRRLCGEQGAEFADLIRWREPYQRSRRQQRAGVEGGPRRPGQGANFRTAVRLQERGGRPSAGVIAELALPLEYRDP